MGSSVNAPLGRACICSRGAFGSLDRVKGSFPPMCSFIRDAILFELRLDASDCYSWLVTSSLSFSYERSCLSFSFFLLLVQANESICTSFLLSCLRAKCLRKCWKPWRRWSSGKRFWRNFNRRGNFFSFFSFDGRSFESEMRISVSWRRKEI